MTELFDITDLIPPALQERVKHVERELEAAWEREEDTLHVYDFRGDPPGMWDPHRERFHVAIVETLLERASNVPADRQAIILGGLMGAGKDTILRQYAGRFGVEVVDGQVTNFLLIDPDTIKEELFHRGLCPQVDQLYPMEMARLVHEESAKIARDLGTRAVAGGKNIVWNISLANVESAQKRIDELREVGEYRREKGGKITGVFVDVSPQHSLRAAINRYQKATEDRENKGYGLGGRWVLPRLILGQAGSSRKYRSRNREAFEMVKEQFDQYFIIDNEDYRGELLSEVENEV
jgi:hypothetical protein